MRQIVWVLAAVFTASAAFGAEEALYERARERQHDLRLGVYLTSGAVEGIFETGQDPVDVLREHGFTFVTIEVYRSGHIVSPAHLLRVRDYFWERGFEVIGGIATTPGGDTGVHQEGPLGWYNWQNPKTRSDLEQIMRSAAPLFDVFVIDDFLCTGDVSEESRLAKGDRPWDQYRCELMARVAREVFIVPAKEENPDITMIVKFPQWYDRFHLFGYPVSEHAARFDRVWVGTETRGARTQRFGFVQPYEGFVNFRWIASVAPDKTECAWFDHGDCDALDFLDQAYQSVLAGARMLSVFNFSDVARGHPGDTLLAEHFEQLADLAATVRDNPVGGIAGYKPVGSEPGGDLYLMDFVGMLGVPLVPTATFPADAKAVFLPTQAAADGAIREKLLACLEGAGRAIVTAGFLARAPGLAELAGVEPVKLERVSAPAIVVDGEVHDVEHGLELAARLQLAGAEVLLEARDDSGQVPFLTRHEARSGEVFVLNCHTFSLEDFDAVGEVLLSPRPLGLLELPQAAVDRLRAVFTEPLGLEIEAPARVTVQPLGDSALFVQNYNEEPVRVSISAPEGRDGLVYRERFSGKDVQVSEGRLVLEIDPRERCWLERP